MALDLMKPQGKKRKVAATAKTAHLCLSVQLTSYVMARFAKVQLLLLLLAHFAGFWPNRV